MSQLTSIQNQVLAALLSGKSVSAAARDNGIHRSTIYHWRHEHSSFGVALEQTRSRVQVNLYDLVQDLTEQALETVAALLESDDANLRLRAAQTILRIAEPARLPKGMRAGVEFETFADQMPAQKALLDLKQVSEFPFVSKKGSLHPGESDTIRHNPTVKSEPARNSRCACGSGLKYKRCCAVSRAKFNPVAVAAA